MVILEGVERLYGAGDDTGALLFLSVSTGAELPALGSYVCGRLVTAGSYAFILQSGKMYRLDDDGTWYACDGSGAYTAGRYEPAQTVTAPETIKSEPLVAEREDPEETENEKTGVREEDDPFDF